MAGTPTKVLFIAGFARSGTTLIGNLLGEYDGVTHAGEVRMLWRRDLARTGPPCGCGTAVSGCDWWTEVLSDWMEQSLVSPDIRGASSKMSEWLVPGASMMEIGQAMTGLQRSAERGSWRRRWSRGDHQHLVTEYAAAYARLYTAIARTANSSVVVDSSKRPVHAAILRYEAGLDPYLLHVVRDPRGVVYSRQRKDEGSKGGGSNPTQAGWDAIKWVQRNVAAERVMKMYGEDRSMFLRYEDFVSDPKGAVEAVLSMLGEPLDGSPFVEPGAAVFGDNHVAGGNRNRFARGRIKITQDLKWLDGLASWDRAVVNALAGVGLNRYGYGRSSQRKVMSAPPRRQG